MNISFVPIALLLSSTPYQTDMQSQKLQIVNKGKWNVQFRSPIIGPESPFQSIAEPLIRKQEKAVMEGLLAEMKKTHSEPHPGWKVPELYYENFPKAWLESAQILSIEVSGEFYLGGAHGMSNVRVYNFGYVFGKPAKFGIWDALYSNAEAKDNLKFLLLSKALKDDRCAWVDEGMVSEFTNAQLERFVVTRTGLRFAFDPYELGPYAAGRIDLEIPFSELKGMIRKNGPLSKFAQ